MGACGCGDFNGGLRFPGPKGIVYVLEIYRGCADCDAPAGIKLTRHRDVPDQRVWFEDEESVVFRDFRGEIAQPSEEASWFHKAIVDPSLVIKAIADHFGDVKCVLDGDPEPMTIREMLKFERDEWREVIDAGIDATLEDTSLVCVDEKAARS